jgi:hypothetical protein
MYKYNLGDALYWIENPMKKEQAMKVIKKEVSNYWSKYIQDIAIAMHRLSVPSLKILCLGDCSI